MRQILWGLFKKIVIADNCATYVNMIFDNYQDQTGSTLVLGALFFAFQIYGDFSGYSDIALGTSRLLGIELLTKFCLSLFFKGYCRILATLAYLLIKLVQGLSIHTIRRQQRRYMA